MISIVMGSDSDFPVVEKAIQTLKKMAVDFEVKVISAHRAPKVLQTYIESSDAKVFIGVAGKAAHLAGVIASYTVRPVIALPVKTSDLGGLDSLLSMVQMPSGIPVATVAINGGENAALLALQILAVSDSEIELKLKQSREKMVSDILEKDQVVQGLVKGQ